MKRPHLFALPLFAPALLAPSLLAFGLSASLAGLTGGCATTGGNRTVTVDGKTMTVDQAAEPLYAEAMQTKAEDPERAAEQLAALIAEYPDSRYADLAVVALAQLRLDAGRPADAQKLVEQLLLDDPTSDVADQARYVLALAQLEQGQPEAAAPTLEKTLEKLDTPEEKRQASVELAETLEEKGQPGAAAKYQNQALELTEDPAQRAEREAALLRLIDEELPFNEVRRLAETEAKPGTFLDEVVLFKLARIHVHLRDNLSADRRLAEYLERYPSGRFASEARALRGQLEARVKVEPAHVGVVLPLSGPYMSYGQRALSAIRIAMGSAPAADDYKGDTSGAGTWETKAKTADGRPIKLVVVDSAGDVQAATRGVTELVETHHVIAILGDILLDTSLPVALKAEELGVPVISLSRRDGLATLGPWTFRLYFTAEKQARALAALAMDQMKLKRFAILYPKHSYGVALMNGFWDEVERRQGEVTAIEAYGHDQTTFTDEARNMVGRTHLEARYEFNVCKNKAKELEDPYRRKKAMESCQAEVSPIVDFDALLIPDDYRTVSYILPAFEAEDVLLTKDKYTVAVFRKTTENRRVRPVQLLGGNMWNDPELGKRLGRKIDGAVFVDGFYAKSGENRVKGFVKDFSDAHRSRPGLLEAQAHDASLLVAAILGGTGGGAATTRQQMRDRLATVKDFPGVTGLLRFDENGDSDTPPMFFTFDKGSLELADSDDLAPGEG